LTTIRNSITVEIVKDQFTETGIALDNALAFWVQRVYQVSRSVMYRRFHALGVELTPEQWMVLVRLWEREGRSQSELCESTLRDRPTMSRILDGMEARGLVSRRTDPEDSRSRLVSLTAAGRQLRGKLVPVVRQLVAELEAGIDERELAVTRRTLQRIFANLEGGG
jgi:MarR family transcriptional regulator, organic hydroperoxide resistance regulator